MTSPPLCLDQINEMFLIQYYIYILRENLLNKLNDKKRRQL